MFINIFIWKSPEFGSLLVLSPWDQWGPEHKNMLIQGRKENQSGGGGAGGGSDPFRLAGQETFPCSVPLPTTWSLGEITALIIHRFFPCFSISGRCFPRQRSFIIVGLEQYKSRILCFSALHIPPTPALAGPSFPFLVE